MIYDVYGLDRIMKEVHIGLEEIERLLNGGPLSIDIDYCDIPDEFRSIIGLSDINIYEEGEEEPIFSYDISLNIEDHVTVFLFDVTQRYSPPEEFDIKIENQKLKKLLTVVKPQDLTAEDIVRDFFSKLNESVKQDCLNDYCEN